MNSPQEDGRVPASNERIAVSVFDTKPYDREYFSRASESTGIDWVFHEYRLTRDTSPSASGATAVCVFVNDALDRACLESLQQLGVRLVALRCAGYNNVDLAAAEELKIKVIRVPAYSPHAVAEHAVGLLLAVNRKLHRAYNRVREQNFSLAGLVGFDLYKKKVGIVGTGKIGKATAQIFRGFGCDVSVFDLYPDQHWAESMGIPYRPLESLWSDSDVLSLHVPLTPQTYHLLNADSLSKTKRGVYIVNTSRGKLIDTSALIQYLKSGWIGGVALDVYEEEEGLFFEDHSGQVLQDDELSRLLTFPNVFMTAHQAFLTQEALTEIARVTVENISRFRASLPFLDGTVVPAKAG